MDLRPSFGADVLDVKITLKPLSAKEILNKINNQPYSSESLEEMVQQAGKILFILPDITRKSGAEYFIHDLIDIVKTYKKPFSVIFAIGTHRQLTEKEKKEILTDEIYDKYADRIIDHDPDDMDNMIYYGKTKHNTPVLLNKGYYTHDTIIPVASVSYHYFAGFGGGRKMLLPGIASRKSALINHKLALDERLRKRHPYAVTGNLKGNPVHDDIVQAVMIARAGKNFFAINTLLNDEGKVVDVEGGDLFLSHIKSCERLKQLTQINTEKRYDAVICSCGGFPKDINMIQAQKSLDRVAPIVKKGGKIIFFAECKDGYGNDTFKRFFDYKSSEDMVDVLFKQYQINRQTAFNLRKITEEYKCYLYSGISEEDAEKMGFQKISGLKDVDDIVKDCGEIAYVPNASQVLFAYK